MRFLTVCEGGNVRSVGLAFALKQCVGQDAIAASWRFNSVETLEMLYEWADYIIVMQSAMADKIPASYKAKLLVVDVGPDVFGSAFHPGLQNYLQPLVADWEQRGFDLGRPA